LINENCFLVILLKAATFVLHLTSRKKISRLKKVLFFCFFLLNTAAFVFHLTRSKKIGCLINENCFQLFLLTTSIFSLAVKQFSIIKKEAKRKVF
jgi:hypothetical protein